MVARWRSAAALPPSTGGGGTGTVNFKIDGPVGQIYDIQYVSDFSAAWQNLTTLNNSTGSVNFSDSIVATSKSRFYLIFVR